MGRGGEVTEKSDIANRFESLENRISQLECRASEKGEKGDAGKSAYEIARDRSGKGDKFMSEDEWLKSLKGNDGKSAYQTACDNGYKGSQDDFNKALANIGNGGGATQKSAYEIAKEKSGLGDKFMSEDTFYKNLANLGDTSHTHSSEKGDANLKFYNCDGRIVTVSGNAAWFGIYGFCFNGGIGAITTFITAGNLHGGKMEGCGAKNKTAGAETSIKASETGLVTTDIKVDALNDRLGAIKKNVETLENDIKALKTE